MSTNFKYSVENFRGLAILFVMLSHVSTFWYLGDIGKYFIFLFIDATTWFVFISGYLFAYLESGGGFNFSKYISKKFKFVVLPYLLFSLPSIFVGLYLDRDILYSLGFIEYVFWSLLVGGNIVGPMWFIPMIVLFFLFSPVFSALSVPNNKLFLLVLTLAFLIFSIFSARPVGNLNPFFSFVHFLGFYLLGLFFFSIRDVIDGLSSYGSLWISICGSVLFLLVLALFAPALGDNGVYKPFYDQIGKFNPMQFGKLVLLLSVFVFFEKFLNSRNKYLGYLAKISFGLFFIHGFYMAVFARFAPLLNLSTINKLLLELVMIIVFSIISVVVFKYILRNRSRYVIGC